MVAHSLVLFAAEAAKEEGSKVAFYVFGLLLAGWAVAVSVVGIRRPAFADARGARSGVVAVSAALVVGACLSAALTG
jgi:hypothetical protein